MTPEHKHWLGISALIAGVIIVFFAGVYLGTSQRRAAQEELAAREAYMEGLQEALDKTNEDKEEEKDSNGYGDDALGVTKLEIDWGVSDTSEPADAKFLAALGDRAYTGNGAKGSVMYKLGTVTGEAYAGNVLYLVVFEAVGMGASYEYYYLLTDYGSSGQVTLVNRSAGRAGLYGENDTAEALMGDDFIAAGFVDVKVATPVQLESVVTVDREVYIPEFSQTPGGVVHASDPIENVQGTGSHDLVVLGVGARLEAFPAAGSIVSRLSDGWPGDTFLRKETKGAGMNLFYTIREDMRTVWYDVVIPFWKPTDDAHTAIPVIAWNDGSQNGETYMKGEIGGCGFQTMTSIVDQDELGALMQIGTATTGEKIYGQQNTESDRLRSAFAVWAIQRQDKTYADFLALRPFFYYEDSFGRWIEFTNTQVTPPGECGKPVIYLYPTTTQDLTVQLAPQGGFTKTEPAYGNGWHVKATPAGVLTNAADGKMYPYLFWEGRGGLYQEPANYWVVAKKDVHTFLSSTLSKLGLNAKEIADFEEFWEPRMTSASYYKIGFHGTETMNQIAPMTLSQKPDTLIRVLMDYAPLAAPIAQKPPTLPKTPVREGFVVTEWGGVIR